MNKILDLGFDDLIRKIASSEIFNDELIIWNITLKAGQDYFNLPAIRVRALVFFLCLKGEISFSIDYIGYQLKQGMLLQINKLNILSSINIENYFEGYMLAVSCKFLWPAMNGIPAIKKTIMYPKRSRPTLELDNEEIQCIVDIIAKIRKIIKRPHHAFQRHILKNEVSSFMLEIANIYLGKDVKNEINYSQSSKEEIIGKFICLILENCKKQHEVSFYADKLCMTSGNLSRIVKAFSGQSTIKWINEALLSESKILLCKPNMNIWQVSEELHFGDQSSFGKFFKKHTGMTPMEYKNKIDKEFLSKP